MPTSTPVSLTDTQKVQISLAERLFNIELTKVITKALAIKYELVDGHNQSRVGTVVTGGLSVAAAFIPLPGATLVMDALIAAGKYVTNKAAQKIVEKRDRSRQDQRLGEIETIDEAARHVAALVAGLTRRYQLVLAQLDPASLEVFVKKVVSRMIHYWDDASNKLKDADKTLPGQGLMDFTQPLPKSVSGQTLTQSEQFD